MCPCVCSDLLRSCRKEGLVQGSRFKVLVASRLNIRAFTRFIGFRILGWGFGLLLLRALICALQHRGPSLGGLFGKLT